MPQKVFLGSIVVAQFRRTDRVDESEEGEES
jgi:hypothetical protein